MAGEDTGRLRRAVTSRARDILFGRTADAVIDAELALYVRADRAHLVMLVEQGHVSAETARTLLGRMDALEADGFGPLRGRPAPRGLYLLYENHLVDALGPGTGGVLHLGRSRNDLKATVLKLRVRAPFRALLREGLRLQAVLIRRAERHAGTVMPLYTHFQAAIPSTYGHYLLGVAVALGRDLRGLLDAARDLDECSLGAGAAGGTSVPIDAGRTAELLGFARPVLHSLDAVASRDLVLRLLGAATSLGVTLSRLATDLQTWSTAEFGMLRFPDHLVGSSSMMPQKRNAFILEHIQGRCGAPLGAFVAAATAMHATPFTNSIAGGTEAPAHLWPALEQVTEAVILARLMAAGAEPVPDAMLRRAVEGHTVATELANQRVLRTGMPFRTAHHEVGEAVRRSDESGQPLEQVAAEMWAADGWADAAGSLDPAGVAAASVYGGGPGGEGFARALDAARASWHEAAAELAARVRAWDAGARALEDATRGIAGGAGE